MLITFFAIMIGGIITPVVCPQLLYSQWASTINAATSIGTGGIVAFTFYYFISVRLEERRREAIKTAVLRAYRWSKRDIASSIIRASMKGGRHDLITDEATIDKILKPDGFRELFEGGREANEGYYAFVNQMTEPTYEYKEIIFSLETMARNIEFLLYSIEMKDSKTYSTLLNVTEIVRRVIHNGTGYDESKVFCQTIYSMFSGFTFGIGQLGYDPVERAIETA